MVVKICITVFTLLFFDLLLGSWYLASVGDQPFLKRIIREKRTHNRVESSVFHHGLTPNSTAEFEWAGNIYPIYVNSLGLIDREVRYVKPKGDVYRILFFGDSFIEGMGYPYDKTAVGMVDSALDEYNIEVLNLGVGSYLPKLHYLKAKYLFENLGVRANEAFIFFDLSDPHNELGYVEHNPNENVLGDATIPKTLSYSLKERLYGFYTDHSLLLGALRARSRASKETNTPFNYGLVMENWTFDDELFDAFGRRGLELSSLHMSKLISLLRQHGINRITVVVYPWPEQIKQRDDNSIHIKFWEVFSKQHGVAFINLYSKFFIRDAEQKLFMQDGEHWNANGHKLVAKTVLSALDVQKDISKN